MTILTATFDAVRLPGVIWLREKNKPESYDDLLSNPPTFGPWQAEVDGFNVEITPIIDQVVSSNHDGRVSRQTRTVTIKVIGDVDSSGPPGAAGSTYPHSYIEQYRTVAAEAANRMLSYFNFIARIPGLGTIKDILMPVPSWQDDQGSGTTGSPMAEIWWPIESLVFDLAEEQDLTRALRAGITAPGLALQVYMDGKTALIHRQLRRATVEAAMAV